MKNMRKIILAICLFTLVASVSGLVVYEVRLRQQEKEYSQLADAAVQSGEAGSEAGTGDESGNAAAAGAGSGSEADAAGGSGAGTGSGDAAGGSGDGAGSDGAGTDGSGTGAAGEAESAYVSPIDWDALWEENEDIYAWIRIEDTVIDYPVLQSDSKHPDYYINHNVDGSAGYPGALFSESGLNEHPLEDRVTIIYGHNMKNGTMFGSLSRWTDDTWRDEHSVIEVFTPGGEYEYTIAFVQLYDNRNILFNYDCNKKREYRKFLATLDSVRMMPSWRSEEIELSADEKMVILSTCSGKNRLLVGGVLTEQEP